MSELDARKSEVSAKRGLLVETFKDRGLYNQEGRDLLVMQQMEEVIYGLDQFLHVDSRAGSIHVEAAWHLVNDESNRKGMQREKMFVEGLRHGLGIIGAMSPTTIDLNSYPADQSELVELGIHLPQVLMKNESDDNQLLFKSLRDLTLTADGDLRMLLFGVAISLSRIGFAKLSFTQEPGTSNPFPSMPLINNFLPYEDKITDPEKELEEAEIFFGFNDNFVAKGKSLVKDWDEIERHLNVIDKAIQIRGSLDLRSRKGIASYLLMSLNQADWDMRLNQIKSENFNDYPRDFFSLIYGSNAGLGWSTRDLTHASIANITQTRWEKIKAKNNVGSKE